MKNLIYSLGLVISAFIMQACGGNADTLKEKDLAPDFTLEDAFGNKYTLSSFRNSKPVVVYFYPKANTPGCTKQACGIRDSWSKFEKNNIIVLGISVDSKEAIKKFLDEHNLNFPLLSDEKKEVAKAYGVLNNLGFTNRVTFIIDREGKIAKIIRKVNVDTHADEVFEIASKL